MKYSGKLFSRLAFVFPLLLSNIVSASQTIIIYRDFGHKGDENQAKGVVHAYSENVKDVTVKEFNIGQEDQLLSYVEDSLKNDEETPIILSVGEKTVSTFANILPVKGGTAIHLCHMVSVNHPQLVGKVNYIALPIHSVGSFESTLSNSQTKLIKTVGVSHNRQINDIERSYTENKDKLPANESYVGVILGGDAPTPENKIQLFTEENARELARYISSNLNGRHLLIINGPRTGKYDPKSLVERKEAHRNSELDFITQAFLDELKNSNVTPKQYSLFDFQFASSKTQDMDLVLGAVRATHSVIFVPGESTSSISESIDVLPSGSVIVYDNTAMNDVHKAHVQSELEAGRITYLREGFKETIEQKMNTKNEQPSASRTIATVLLNNN